MKLNLYYERTENAWSQAYVAKKLEVSQSYYCMVEAGDRNPSLALIKKLEALFGYSHDYLLSVRGVGKGGL